ncbi:hypothetical protein LPJ53_005948, partial [Coemansia erecta]
LSEEEKVQFRKYGRLPTNKNVLKNRMKERKFFDSGDYALQKAGKGDDAGVAQVGHEHPSAETIHHPLVAGSSAPGAGTPAVEGGSVAGPQEPKQEGQADQVADVMAHPISSPLSTVPAGTAAAPPPGMAQLAEVSAAPGGGPVPPPGLMRRVSQPAGMQYQVKK